PYRNYVAQARLGVSREAHEQFFRDMLGDIDEPTLPFGLQDVQGDGSGIEEVRQDVEVDLSRRLRAQARQLGVSAASLYHLVWAQVLGQVAGREDVVFGTVLMGRMQGGEGADRALGMFINTLPLRVSLGQTSVHAAVKATHARLTELLGHEHASLVLAQRCSGVEAPTPLFSALLNYRHIGSTTSTEALSAWNGIQVLGGEERTNYPLTLSVDDLGEAFSFTVMTPARIGAQRLCGYVQRTLEGLIQMLEQTPEAPLHRLSILPASEYEQLLVAFNATQSDYPLEQTIHGLFEAQVQRTPDAVAVIRGEQRLTYHELNERANRLAHYLRKQGVQPDSRVAICVERGIDMVVGLLAILKAGGGYVPLDPAYPLDRIAYMLKDSAPAAVLAQTATLELLAGASMPVVDLDSGLWQDESVQNPEVAELTSSHLAYVIYTSGSTGLPKGVMIEHRNTVNFLTWAHRSFDDATLSKTLFSTSLNFDLAVYECFAPLTSGGSIDVVTNVLELQQGEHDITLINTVPSALKALLESGGVGEGVDTVNVAGEALKRSLVETLFEQTQVKRLCNLYGPSETTTYSSWVSMAREDGFAAHIGKPVANTQFYLLDEHKQPVPLGVPGEIYIGGAGVARGYLNRDDLTAERFLKDPFSLAPNARMYRTGDLGRYLPDGNIEYLGRNDDQVKIRGFRIELGEIEAKLAQAPNIKETVVLAREDVPGDKRLVAYFTQHSPDEAVAIETLRTHLQAQLPAYMVPAAYVRLDALPLTPNGKLDRKALPAPDPDAVISRGYEAPQGDTETVLAQIWEDLLGLEQVGRHDHFFELGGHSLLAVSLIERMRQAGLSADVRVLFGQPTLAALAAAVGRGREVVVPANRIPRDCATITPDMLPLVILDQETIDRIVLTVPGGVRNVQDIYPLAPSQEGILYHHLSAEQGDPYVLQARFALQGRQRLDDFVQALQGVIDRHDILRTAMLWQGLDAPLQVVWREARLGLEELVLDPQAGDIIQQLHSRFDARRYALDITQAPLIRLAFAEDKPNQRWVAMLLFHHMALDHTALEVVRNEMQANLLGQADQLGEAVPYRNYVAQACLGVSREEHEAFFREMLGDIDAPTLPFGLQDVQGDGSDIEEARLVLDSGLSRRLRRLARQSGVGAASLHHLAWAQVLGRVSGKNDLVFGTVLMGRMQGGEGADHALGMFINTLPLRVAVDDRDVKAGLKAVHGRLSALLGHEHASLALAQRCSAVSAPTPLFSALLNYRHSSEQPGAEDALSAWQGIETLGSEERTNYPLTLSVDDLGEDFALTVLAVAGVGAGRVCGYMNAALQSLATALESSHASPLYSLDILPSAERQQLLTGFNTTTCDYPRDSTVHAVFQAQVLARPDATAAVQGAQGLTYRELNARANRLAHHLIELGVQPGQHVAILLERSLDLLVSQLAVLKCAAVYVPLDINAPTERQQFMVRDSGAGVVLTVSGKTLEPGTRRVDLDRVALDSLPAHDPQLLQSSEMPAYIMYTSGSTGTPKGVLVPHRAINRLVINNGYADFNARDRVAFASNPAFDASTLDVWAPLLNGGCVVVVEQDVLLSQERFAALLAEQSVSVLWMTAGLFHQYASGLTDVFRELRYLIVGGDVLDPAVIDHVLKEGAPAHLLNGYGPTEATTFSTTHEIKTVGAGSIPIGRPLGNTRVYILDAYQQPVPIGVAGELYIGGDGIAKGYLNRPELTVEKFVADPFSADPDALLYRTGDLARWLPEGTVEYLGRNDDQVKIRGFRIEPGEIEARLAKHDDVKDAVILVREDVPGEKTLVAYFTLREPSEATDIQALRAHLQAQLPDYMVPVAYVRLDVLPLTANGKVDRKVLPAPDVHALVTRDYEAPQGEVETTLALLWAELLDVERVGRHDHFFELGGHSLLAVKLIEKMRQLGLRADVRVLFSQPTLAALAAAVGGGCEVHVPANLIVAGCARITPAMLPLMDLDQEAIDRIVATVPGGVGNVQDIYPLAPLQEGILYHHLVAGQGDPYVLQASFELQSRERLTAFVDALQHVIDRHDILRTSVVWQGFDSPIQVVWREAKLHLEEVALDGAAGDVAAWLQSRFDPRHYRLDITQAPMMRLAFAEDASNQRWVAVLLFHHMALDHTAMEVVQHEMQAHLLGEADQLGAAVPYRNYVAQARLGAGQQAHEAFFREMLGDMDEPTLPFGLQDVQGDGRDIEHASQPLDAALSLRLRALARQLGVSAASLVHLAWAQVLGKASGKDDVVFGTVLMGRMQGGDGADRALGMFINTLPLRVDVGEQTVRTGVKTTHARLTALLGHEHAPLVLAQRCSGVEAPLPLFSGLLNYRHSVVADSSAQYQAAWSGIEGLGGEERTNYPLTLNVDDLGEGFTLSVLVTSQVSAQRVCAYMHTALESLADALEQAPDSALRELSIVPAAEREQLLVAFNATEADYPRQQTIHGLFEAQVQRTPDAVAVIRGEQRLSYRELNERANRLAHHLRKQGVEPDSRVAICVERGIDMVVGLLAILKAGGGYVPLDPAYPLDRIAYMLEDSAPAAVLAQDATVGLLSDASMAVINLDSGLWQDESVQNPEVAELTSSHLAYVIYTSGSTGLPKGVMIEHRNTVNFLAWAHRSFDSQTLAKTLFSTSLNFDLAVYECFAPLTSGGSIDVVTNVLELQQGEHDITLINTVPSALKALLESGGLGEGVDTVNVAGEALKRSLVEALFEQTQVKRLCNLYGPSETTTYSSWVSMAREDGFAAHIGKPVANTQFYLLDEHKQPVPLSVPGEIYIGGAGVARGYLNRDDLTAERFLKDPFSTAPNARMYRTGDLGRYLPDGNIEYLGRNDDQVKIRGFRIELGEIEAKLAQAPNIKESVVLAREDVPGDKRLVAYFTQNSPPEALDIEALRTHLQAQLPAYMVPVAYVRLDALPLTPNGKLDRKALPTPDLDALITRGYEAPQGEIETTLAQVWSELLKVERVGRHDHFFELGGHSLLAVTLIERMRQAGLSADVRALFSQPTLAALAAAVGGGHEVSVPQNRIPSCCEHITPAMLPLVTLDQQTIDRIVSTVPGGVRNVQDIYPLAPLQEGILYHHLSSEQGDPYVLQTQFAFDSRERLDDFTQALQGVIDRHDILRTSMAWEGLEEPVQVVWREAVLGIEQVSLRPEDGDIARQLQARFDARHHRLDIRQAPLMCIRFAQDAVNQRWVATLLFHHMALDHTALEVVRHEMQAYLLGQADQLGAAVPYRNYVAQARLGVGAQEHEGFFREMLGDVDEPTLPFGLTQVQGDGRGIEEVSASVDEDLSLRLRAQARRLGVGAASLIHLAWARVLAVASGQENVVFGTVLMGRMQGGEGADRALGMFINTLPICVPVNGQSVRDAVKTTHLRLTGLLGHEHASLALAQRCSEVASPAPLFSALLNLRHSSLQVTDEGLSAWNGMQILSSEERTNYPLTLNVDDLGEGFSLTVQVESRIGAQRICDYVQVALHSLVDTLEHAPQTAVRNLTVLPPAERTQLLETWNAPEATYAHDALIHRQFEAQVATQPDAVAVVFEDQALTYGELNAQANQLAHRLLSLGVNPDDRVAICVERGLDMIVGLLGILKAGAGYVPLDPASPAERIVYMLEDSSPVAIVVHAATHGLLAEESVRVIELDSPALRSQSTVNPQVPGLTSSQLAYVIYTSGSTGLPKGVMVEHRNVARLFSATQPWFDFGPQDVWALFHSFAFDFSVWEIWGALTHGGRLLVVPQLVSRSPQECYALLCEAGVTVLNQTPSAFRQLIAAQGESDLRHSLRQVIFGGEALETGMLKPWFARAANAGTQLVNMYGITETTVHVTYRPLEAADAQLAGVSPIGKRIPDLQLYVLDARREPVPVGVVGEMYVGGAGVARGYLNRPELTRERFIDDTFSGCEGARLYRTGDLGRWLADGSVEYLGRNDDQVKIRGFRIELGEIETTLAACQGVSEAVVIAREDEPGDKRLVAYVIAAEGASLTAADLRAQLLGSLAEYMVPGAFVVLDVFPLTTNGKLDRKALPAPDQSSVATREYEAPQGEAETVIAAIWQDLLDLEQVGRHDNFFELGGHSLLAVKLIERMRHAGLSADVRVLFGQPTLAALAAAVGGYSEVVVPANGIPDGCTRITPDMLPLAELDQWAIDGIVSKVPGGVANVQDIYALAPLQEGILYHHLAAAKGDPYLQYMMFAFDSFTRLESFTQALQSVVARHDILRTGVLWKGLAEPMQVVWREARLAVEAVTLDPVAGDIATQLHECFDPRHYRLDIRQAPLMRVAYAQDAANQRWVGMLLFHHLVDDATSLAALSAEIEAHMLGQAQRLPASVPYRNYVAQARLGVSREAHEQFFRDMLGDIDEPTLP
ncbi:non-ribosomal peptide synthetase, partial [Pseudomonas sp. OA65]|uniref:non-ribosomal peptide synthetase n=1 Tax=Pseudomonas sp. OA65 TaxID=2818431 RepID=UPI001A9CD521